MKALTILVILFLSIEVFSQSSRCEKCSIETLSTVNGKMPLLSSTDIEDFLCTLSSSCSNNVEFSEFSSELLLDILYEMPQLFFNVICKIDSDSLSLVVKKLEAPIVDTRLIEIRSRFSKVNGSKKLKRTLLSALDKSLEKLKLK